MTPTTTNEALRARFEAWISAPPYERSVNRWPMDETKHAWPGQYGDVAVQIAWEAWCEALKFPDDYKCPLCGKDEDDCRCPVK